MVDAEEEVILVDEEDRPLGTLAKLEAHRTATRHRAFSVFLSDSAGNVLLQSRAAGKYHSAGLWSNACCGHPRPGETPLAAARRRLFEEMGLDVPLRPAGTLSYAAALPNGWYENELVHLFTGVTDADPAPAPEEVGSWRKMPPEALRAAAGHERDAFTTWFRIYLDRIPAIALNLRAA
jgi:isopentenyl-diphosphate Delta-isomerase